MSETVSIEEFMKFELRTAKVVEARPHPNADKLLLLQVEVGDEKKQIIAGIRGHYEPEALVGRTIVIVNNLEPAMLRGEESQGMLLAASHDDRVLLLRPDEEIPSGCKIK
ncbi:Methionine--tRNA ligase [Planctomycetes bacterium Pan216]|uniref:Methionine--tRNA ligase n=1 Tax=Kolteria novifilia TaxID=2527975 RepID=A0A518AXQ4_9BACT|nr:Methionine--tRNA ligase [Planctomycetes bacterium Pan216]